ncbi:MAG: hypothetical protein AB2L13_01485 [Spirochaetota bacterium]
MSAESAARVEFRKDDDAAVLRQLGDGLHDTVKRVAPRRSSGMKG